MVNSNTSLTRRRPGGLSKFNPKKAMQGIAVAEMAEKHYRKARNREGLEKAIRSKLELQAELVLWWDTQAEKSKGAATKRRSRSATALVAGADGMPERYTLARWRKRLGMPDTFERTLQDAVEKAARFCEHFTDQKRPRSGNASHDNDDEWYTPPAIIEACRSAMGGIDLDPASHAVANSCVKAKRYFTAKDDGLAQTWKGRVFLNPPYSKRAGKSAFIAKLAESFDARTVTAATVVLSYDFSASWFEPLRGRYAAICLCRGRVQFYKATPGDGHDPALGTSIIYLGTDVQAFADAFHGIGDIVVPFER